MHITQHTYIRTYLYPIPTT